MSTDHIQENQININGLSINYKMIGNSGIPIVLLHGWGISSDRYLSLAEYLLKFKIQNSKFKIFVPDLPGFGKSEEPKENWNLDDYTEFVNEFMEKIVKRKTGFEFVGNLLKKFYPTNQRKEKRQPLSSKKIINNKIVLIGHSFGGRIAIKYAVKYPEKIEKLILTGAAGIKHPLSAKKNILLVMAKIGRIIFSIPGVNKTEKYAKTLLYKTTREKDYYCASPRMKEIMKNVINEDLRSILNQIKAPTLLLWGKNDHSTPLSDGKTMHEKINNSELVIVDNANHGLPYRKPEKFAEIVINFIKK